MKTVQKGFTLIELMIVIAIVAILVALAVPAYQDYTIRAKVSECVNGAAPAKLAVSEYFQSEGAAAAAPEDYGVNTVATSQYCQALAVDAVGVITVTTVGTGATTDPVMTLTPVDAAGAAYNPASNEPVSWNCQNTAGEDRHVPATCRS
ncbi:MAG: pilin [Xanthomonadales bacterium]|jgi:type IV pilus assembly protein PilA|nr:pilin [Xanthomonadales bacterium]